MRSVGVILGCRAFGWGDSWLLCVRLGGFLVAVRSVGGVRSRVRSVGGAANVPVQVGGPPSVGVAGTVGA